MNSFRRPPRDASPVAHRRDPVGDPPPPRFSFLTSAFRPFERHETLEGVAARLAAMRAGRGMAIRPAMSSGPPGYGAYEAAKVVVWPKSHGTDEVGMEEWLGLVTLPHADVPALRAAVKAADRALRSDTTQQKEAA